MRHYAHTGLGYFLASAILAASTIVPVQVAADFDKPKRRATGERYPHSSARQQARYARQIAAGQITFIQHGPRAA